MSDRPSLRPQYRESPDRRRRPSAAEPVLLRLCRSCGRGAAAPPLPADALCDACGEPEEAAPRARPRNVCRECAPLGTEPYAPGVHCEDCDLVQCGRCGHRWDGNAQCDCPDSSLSDEDDPLE